MENDRFDEKELRRRLIHGVKWAASLKLLAQAYSWIVSIVIVRFLLPEDYGLNAMLEVPIELVMLFSTLGLDLALVRKQHRSREELSAAFGLLLVVNISFFFCLVFGASSIATYFKDPRLTPLIQVASAVFLLLPFGVIPNVLLDRELAFKLRSQIELVATFVASSISLAMAMLGAGVWALVVALVGGASLRVLLLAYMKPWLILPSFRFGNIGEIIRLGGLMTLSGVLIVIAGRVVNLIAGPVLGAELLGYFAIASGFAFMPLSKLMPIVQQTMYPAFARLENRPELTSAYYYKSLELASLVIIPMSIGLTFVSTDFVLVVFGKEWVNAAWPLTILSSVIPLRMIVMLTLSVLNGTGFVKSTFAINLFMLVLLTVGAPISLSWKLDGLVYLWATAAASTCIYSLVTAKLKLGVNIARIIDALYPASTCALIMVLVLSLINNLGIQLSDISKLIIEVAAGAIVYAGGYVLIFRRRFSDILKNLRST